MLPYVRLGQRSSPPRSRAPRIIDVREPSEFTGELGHVPGAELLPPATVEDAARDWARDEPFVVACRSGARSAKAAATLVQRGFKRVFNLEGDTPARVSAGPSGREMMVLTLALSVLIGVSLGLLGGGGSILTVPVLMYAAGLAPKDGIATSLLVVGTTSVSAMLFHARGGRVAWRVGLLFGVASMISAYGGGRLAHVLPAKLLLAGFTLMMFVTALAMMRRRREGAAAEVTALRGAVFARAAAIGVAIGLLTGIIGAGGGFVLVPALVLLGGLPMRTAVATSLLVIAMNSFAGFAGTLSHATIHWSLALAVTAASVVGSLVGAALAGRAKPESLRSGFAWFVLAMALFMTFKQLPASATFLLATHLPLVALAALGGSLVLFVLFRMVRARGARSVQHVRSLSQSAPGDRS